MKKINIKRIIASGLSLLTMATCLSAGSVAYAEDLVAINETNFADKNFRTILSQVYDKDSNGYLSTAEIESVTVMSLSGYLEEYCGEGATIESMSGIEKFTNLEKLYCASVGLQTLDVSSNTALTQLTCMGNAMQSLTLGSLPNLTRLNCSDNELTSLDVTGCTELQVLQANVNKLTSIDVSKNTKLTLLYVYQNDLTSLNTAYNLSLNDLRCSSNHIAELDLSTNTSLANISTEFIGNQWIDLNASVISNQIRIYKTFRDFTKIVSTTLDKIVETEEGEENVVAYTGGYFVADELSAISGKLITSNQEVKDGFVYKYNVNNSNCDLMTVNAVVARSMYQVNFYLDESKTTRIDYKLVESGKSAAYPTVPAAPTCKRFVSWSADCSAVNSDMEVYIIWADDHNMVKNLDSVTGEIDVECTKCNTRTLHFNFMDTYNLKQGDEGFNAEADLNGDGVVNAKDYAIILKY